MYTKDKQITRTDEDGVHGTARHAHDFEEEDGELGEISYLFNDFIDLSDVLLEQLVLQIPMQPFCEMSLKGEHCQRAKIDLDRSRIVNEKLATTKPFSVLKNFKIKG